MVGQGVLRECLVDAGVTEVLAVGRSPTGVQHAKLREVLHDDFTDFSKIESQLAGYDACFFCLGVSSIGMDPERYRHLTYDVTMAAAKTLARLNPGMVFTYVTGQRHRFNRAGPVAMGAGQGQDRERPLKLPFKAAYMFRPSGIQPLHGVRSKTAWINAVYAVTAPLLSWMVRRHAEPHDDQRATRPRHDQGGARWLSEADPGERGYQRDLVSSFRGSPQG